MRHLEALLWSIARLITSAVPVYTLLGSGLVLLKVLDLVAVHILDNVVCLPLLEAESQASVRVVLVVGLVFVVLDLDKVRVDSRGVER